MSWRSDSSQLFAGKWTSSLYAGLGIQAQNIPSTGESGPAALYNDIAAQSAAPTDEMMWEILTVPASGVFTPYESSEFTLIGASDGVHFATYRGKRNGVAYGDYTVTMTIGSQSAAVAITMPQMSASISAGVTTPSVAATVSLTMPQMTAAVSGNVVAVGNSASVSFTMPQMVAAASASQTVPVFSATISATMPQMQIACSADVQAVAGVSANIALTMPQMIASATASTTAPIISASISFTMPQMSVYVLSGEFDYYNGAGTRIETVAASTHIEYTL